MKIVVIGGTGLIGSKVVSNLRQKGHEVIAASPNSGINTITGEGLAEAVAGAQVVIDAGESWSEMPGDHHAISANASDTEPAKLLAVFVVDTKETKLVTDDAQ